jgi:uncharacterized membrane protein (DUF485 family)
MESPNPDLEDLTPVVGAQTDIAPLGRDHPKPAHELTAEEENGRTDWDGIAETEQFKALLSTKARFIVPATIFFVIYFFALPLLVGYFPKFMETTVIGSVNLAYLFALSQFIMAWVLAALYVRAAAGWDKKVAELLAGLSKKQ